MVRAQNNKSKRQITEEKENFLRHSYIWELLTKYCTCKQYSGENDTVYLRRIRQRKDSLYLFGFKALLLATITNLPLSSLQVIFHNCTATFVSSWKFPFEYWSAFLTFGLETSWSLVENARGVPSAEITDLRHCTQCKGPCQSPAFSGDQKQVPRAEQKCRTGRTAASLEHWLQLSPQGFAAQQFPELEQFLCV